MSAIRSLEPFARFLLRIVAGFTFSLHGMQKFFGLFGGMMGRGPAAFGTLPWVAGVLETIGGLLIILGLFTTPVAFILSGEMAVAYFRVHFNLHFPAGVLPILNRGELAALYCFIFFYFFTVGAGPFSLDSIIWKKSSP